MTNELRSTSPFDANDELGRFRVAGANDVDHAVARARSAFPAWRDAGFEARAAILQRFRNLAAERVETLAQLITREMGKAIWDARGEARLIAADLHHL